MSEADSVRPSSELIDLSHSKAELISLNRWKHVHRTHTKRVNDEATTSQSETAMEASPCSRVVSLLNCVRAPRCVAQTTGKRTGKRREKLHHQTQAWSARLRFSQSPHIIHPAAVTHNISRTQQNRVSFSLPSFTRNTEEKIPLATSACAGLKSFSVDPSNGEHLHIHIAEKTKSDWI